jgi:hypothetical protein
MVVLECRIDARNVDTGMICESASEKQYGYSIPYAGNPA